MSKSPDGHRAGQPPSEGIDRGGFAKCIGVTLVVEATDRIDSQEASEALGSDRIRLLSEAELFELAPDCEIGAIPPIGELWGLPVYADNELREDRKSHSNAATTGTRFASMVPSWVQAAHVIYADIAEAMAGPASAA